MLGHDKLNPKESDYTTILTKIKAMNPDALYYGGVQQAAVKLAKQANDVMPGLPKMGGDGVYSVSFPVDAGRAPRRTGTRRLPRQTRSTSQRQQTGSPGISRSSALRRRTTP